MFTKYVRSASFEHLPTIVDHAEFIHELRVAAQFDDGEMCETPVRVITSHADLSDVTYVITTPDGDVTFSPVID